MYIHEDRGAFRKKCIKFDCADDKACARHVHISLAIELSAAIENVIGSVIVNRVP